MSSIVQELGSIWPKMSWAFSVLIGMGPFIHKVLNESFQIWDGTSQAWDGWTISLQTIELGHFKPDMGPFKQLGPFRLAVGLTRSGMGG